MPKPDTAHRRWTSREVLFVGVMMAAAIFLRAWNLGTESFWLDETYSARIIDGPFATIIDRIPKDKPPLDYYLQAMTHNLGEPEVSHRIPALVCGCLAVFIIFLMARDFFGRAAGAATLVFAATSPFLIYYAQEARPYSPFLATIAAQQWGFLAWLRARRRGGRGAALWIATLILGIAALYTLYAALLVFAAEAALTVVLAVLDVRAEMKSGDAPGEVKRRRLADAAPGLAMLALTVASAWPLRHRAIVAHVPESPWDYGHLGAAEILRVLGEVFVWCDFGQWSLGWSFVGLAGGVAGYLALRRRDRPAAGYMALVALGLVPPVIAFYSWLNHVLCSRYFIFLMPATTALWGGAAIALGKRLARLRPSADNPHGARFGIALALLISAGPLAVFEAHYPYRMDFKSAAKAIADDDENGVPVVTAQENVRGVLDYYLKRMNRPDIRTLTQARRNEMAPMSECWEVSVVFTPEEIARSQYNGLDVNHFRADAGLLTAEQRAASLDKDGLLWPGKCPAALLGPGWSAVENWAKKGEPEFPVRWALAPEVTLDLPVDSADPKGTASRKLELNIMAADNPTTGAQTIQLAMGKKTFPPQTILQREFRTLSWTVEPKDFEAGLKNGCLRLALKFNTAFIPAEHRDHYIDYRTLFAVVLWARCEPVAAR